MELDEILSDKKPEEAPPVEVSDDATPPESAEAPEVERVQSRRREHRAKELAAQGRDPDTGQFVSKEEKQEKTAAKAEEKPAEPAAKTEVKPEVKAEVKPAEPPKEDLTPRERAAFAATADERRKRQALEQELAKYRGGQQPPAQTTEKPKTFWDDPEAALAAFKQETQQANVNTRLQTAELIARNRYTDFDEKVQAFSEIVASAPWIADQWLKAADPAEFAYRTGKSHIDLREAGGLDQLRAKIEKETRERVEKEVREKADKERAERAAIPPSLSQVRGASTQQRAEWTGPPPLVDILKG